MLPGGSGEGPGEPGLSAPPEPTHDSHCPHEQLILEAGKQAAAKGTGILGGDGRSEPECVRHSQPLTCALYVGEPPLSEATI